ncbi:HAD-IA family hydrolase [Qipengyuania spongiae]|uniref:HAD-IA family hydrolase n=1 Tax=Qipengyuania spongiae TaxID=2909673 RepID=A0ABY5T489_9SPHN|nr:HAD-IA family hydrolase [Qipengyuania spongiae]UVI40404.1 HAD-IA family hydrolase [Qipengyuania spongiae]
MTRLAIFDCDGTLVDGQASICEAMEAGFASANLTPPDRNTIRRMVGLSLPQALRRLAPDASAETQAIAVQGYKDSFSTARAEGRLREPLYDGMAELLGRLHREGWLLAVATGKSDRGLNACLAMHDIADFFISLQTADRHPSKPDPAMLLAALDEAKVDPAGAVMIGDTTFDIAMARTAGVRAIGVAWGYHKPEELLEEGADAVARTMDELEALIRG